MSLLQRSRTSACERYRRGSVNRSKKELPRISRQRHFGGTIWASQDTLDRSTANLFSNAGTSSPGISRPGIISQSINTSILKQDRRQFSSWSIPQQELSGRRQGCLHQRIVENWDDTVTPTGQSYDSLFLSRSTANFFDNNHGTNSLGIRRPGFVRQSFKSSLLRKDKIQGERWFSYSTIRQQESPREIQARLHQRIVEICDDTIIPYGELSLEVWKESLQILEEMTELNTAFGLECSCMLLERLVIEQATPRSTTDYSLPQLTTQTLNLVLDNWRHCWQQPGPDRTPVEPPQMLSLVDDWLYRVDNALHPNVKTYRALLQGAIKSHFDPMAAKLFAQQLFHRMKEEADAKIHPNVRPDTFVYATLIHFLAQLGEIQQAEAYLNEMYMEYAAGHKSVEPNVKIFSSVLMGYSNMAGTDKDPGNEVPARAESILRHMQHLHDSGTLGDVNPNSFVYGLVLKCWSRSKDPQMAIEPAQRLYHEMKTSHNANIRPTSQALSYLMQILSRAGDGPGTQALLDEHLQDNWASRRLPKLNRSCFRSALMAWDKSRDEKALENAEKILQKIKKLPSLVKPDTVAYNTVLNCLVHHKGPAPSIEDRVKRAEAIVQEMEEAGDHQSKPDVHSYNRLIQMHAMERQDPYRAEEVLERMYRFHLADNHSKSTQPNVSSFSLCLKAWSDSWSETAPDRAEGILKRMWKLHNTGVLPDLRPDLISYKTALQSIERVRPPDAGKRCEQLLQEMAARTIPPDATCYALSVRAWTRAKAPEQGERLLEQWLDKCKKGSVNEKPELSLYQSILSAWARSKRKDAGEKAASLIQRMYRQHKSGLLEEPPDRKCYLSLINTWANSKLPWACERAEKVVHQMESMAKAGNQAIAPGVEELNAVLCALALSGRGPKAQKLLDRMLGDMSQEPNLESFKSVLLAWKNSKQPTAPDKVESILQRMDELVETGIGVKPDAECLNVALNCLAKQTRNMNPLRIESLLLRYKSIATWASWNMVIDFCASLGNARKAESLMRSRPDKPDAVAYTMVLKALSNSTEKPNDIHDNVERLLREMYELYESGDKRVKPNNVTFGTAMNCYIRSDHPQAVQHVEGLRDEVIERSNSGEEDLAYNNIIFHAVLQAHSGHGDPQDAECLLDQLCREVLEGKNEQAWELTSLSLASVLGAWVRANKPKRAELILQRMCEYRDKGVPNVEPIPRNYIAIIECRLNGSEDPLAGELADDVLSMMEKDHPKVVAVKGLYLNVMKGLAQSGSGERAEALLRRVQTIFQDQKCNTELDLFLYREVCLAWNQSKCSKAAERIKLLEDEMLERFPTSRISKS